ncbi:AAA family ATPase [Ramlibacter sp. G-1-2-2]|uniref:AAA family ATPase n=1 Tax=Ramlibacter agri TaxID=2728837 RepID=A0A848GZ82_9BURK|nr:AAA family ATPase [Ramlibacter agri]NML42609.1 AAA family ATPase [Ramlibacter agri]
MSLRDDSARPAPAAEGWLLALTASGSQLTCFLSDGFSRFRHAAAAWPPVPGAPALPAPLLRDIADGTHVALRLQLDASLDAWPWESELDAARAGLRVSRYLGASASASNDATPVMLGARGGKDAGWVHGSSEPFAQAVALQEDGGALVVVSQEVEAARAERFRAQVLAHWGPQPSLSQAAVEAADAAGLTRAEWRLYGEARFVPGGPADEEWRQVSSVSIDLVKSTGLLKEWGAERYARKHGDFYQHCREVVEAHHGRVDDPQGDDGLMAYFGLQEAREDAATQAVRAAWELAARAPALGFGVRIGITTGRVAVRNGLPFGDLIHLAARLQRVATVNGIVVSDATHGLLARGVVCESLPEPLHLDGFDEPQQAWRVVQLEAPPGGFRQREGLGAFVGRQQELAVLKEAWFVVRATGRAQFRCVVGEPGIGKTRLLQEFERELRRAGEAVAVVTVTGHQELQSSAFAALAKAFADSPLAQLAGLLPGAKAIAGRPRDRNETLRRLVEGCLRSAGETPLCLVVDDAQWLDPSTIDFVERLRLAAEQVPLLSVVSLREEARGLLRGLDAQKAITLAALAPREALDLIGSLPAARLLSPDIRQFVAERTGGIPLFVEETVRMIGQLQDGALNGIPATLEGLLTARLDALGPAKPLAQIASVLGVEFPLALWEAMLADEEPWIQRASTQETWQRLVDAGLMVVEPSDVPRCRFRHALIRDAAYNSLWSTDRMRLHAVAARVLQAHSPDGATALRAHHLAEAGEREAACAAWAQAAREAAAAGADREALLLSQRALDTLQELPATPATRGQALQQHLLQAARHIALDGYGANSVEAAYLRAAALCTDDEDEGVRLRVELGLEACYAMRGDLARAKELAESAVRRTSWDANLRYALQARWAWGNVVFHLGDIVGALAMGEECLARYDPALHHRGAVQDPAIMFLCYGGWGAFQQGRGDAAYLLIGRALELARTLDHQFSQAIAYGFAASVSMFCGDHEEGLQHAEEAIRRCSAKDFQAWLAHAQVMRGRVRAALGEVRAGLDDMEEGLALWTATGARITAATYLALQAEVWLEQGEPETALRKVTLAQEIARQHGERYYEAELLRLRGAAQWQLRSSPAHASVAEGLLRQALELARQQRNLGLALRAALALGQAWAESHRVEQAIPLLDEAMAAVPGHTRTRDYRAAQDARRAWAGSDRQQQEG